MAIGKPLGQKSNGESQTSSAIRARRTYQGRKTTPCPDCGQHFAGVFNMEQHRRGKHTGLKPFDCSVCGKGYARAYTRNRHMRSAHGCDATDGSKVVGKSRPSWSASRALVGRPASTMHVSNGDYAGHSGQQPGAESVDNTRKDDSLVAVADAEAIAGADEALMHDYTVPVVNVNDFVGGHGNGHGELLLQQPLTTLQSHGGVFDSDCEMAFETPATSITTSSYGQVPYYSLLDVPVALQGFAASSSSVADSTLSSIYQTEDEDLYADSDFEMDSFDGSMSAFGLDSELDDRELRSFIDQQSLELQF